MKIQYSDRNISPFGGIVPILKTIKDCGVPKVIRDTLGNRCARAEFSYEDVFISWILTSLCGGMRLDHISRLKNKLSIIPGLEIPSHDVLGKVLKSLARKEPTKKDSVVGRGNKMHVHTNKYDDHDQLNDLLVNISKRIGALESGKEYVLHIDATFIETDCSTSKFEIKSRKYGYYPMVCLIDEMPVYISMRNGDSNASFQLTECLKKCLDLLEKYGIKVKCVVSDTAGYVHEMLDFLQERGIEFNVHIPFNSGFKNMFDIFENLDDWEKIEFESPQSFRICEISEFNYTMIDSPFEYRIVVAREPSRRNTKFYTKEQIARLEKVEEHFKRLQKENPRALKGRTKPFKRAEWKKHGSYKYKLLITNNRIQKQTEVMEAYNKRGTAEQQFAAMKNDFGWRLPPFSRMEENTVFMITSAIANNVFRGLVRRYKKILTDLRLETRLKAFVYAFVSVACENIGNETYVYYNAEWEYEKLIE